MWNQWRCLIRAKQKMWPSSSSGEECSVSSWGVQKRCRLLGGGREIQVHRMGKGELLRCPVQGKRRSCNARGWVEGGRSGTLCHVSCSIILWSGHHRARPCHGISGHVMGWQKHWGVPGEHIAVGWVERTVYDEHLAKCQGYHHVRKGTGSWEMWKGCKNCMGGLALFQAVSEAELAFFSSWCEMLGLCYFWSPTGTGSSSTPLVSLCEDTIVQKLCKFMLLSPRDASAGLPLGRRQEENPSCHAFHLWCHQLPPLAVSPGLVCFSCDSLFRFSQMCPLVCHCSAGFGGIQVSTGLACCCVCKETEGTAPCLGSPNMSTDAGIPMGYQTSGNIGYARMHESLELPLLWKLVILSYARHGTLFGGWGLDGPAVHVLDNCL